MLKKRSGLVKQGAARSARLTQAGLARRQTLITKPNRSKG